MLFAAILSVQSSSDVLICALSLRSLLLCALAPLLAAPFDGRSASMHPRPVRTLQHHHHAGTPINQAHKHERIGVRRVVQHGTHSAAAAVDSAQARPARRGERDTANCAQPSASVSSRLPNCAVDLDRSTTVPAAASARATPHRLSGRWPSRCDVLIDSRLSLCTFRLRAALLLECSPPAARARSHCGEAVSHSRCSCSVAPPLPRTRKINAQRSKDALSVLRRRHCIGQSSTAQSQGERGVLAASAAAESVAHSMPPSNL